MNSKTGQHTQILEIGEIVERSIEGDFRIPDFQRSFRWKPNDALQLFDSILKGYPIGSLLLWQRPADAARLKFGRVEIDASKNNEALWIVDGQQRITSLVNVLLSTDKNDDFSLSLNLESGNITRSGKDIQNEVPLSTIFSTKSTVLWLQENVEHMDKFEILSGISDRIRRYRVPASVVVGEDEKVVREIFDRLNNFGKRLNRSEVFEAIHRQSGEDNLSVKQISENINSKTGFGIIDESTILKCILAQRGYDIHRDIHQEFDGENGSQIQQSYQEAEDSILRAVDFIKDKANIPHFSFIPYTYIIVILSRLFGVIADIDEDDYKKLKIWFWRAIAVGPEGGSHTATSRALSKAIIEDDIKNTISNLFSFNFNIEPSLIDDIVDSFRTNTARSKLAACLYWQAHPLDLANGEEFDVDSISEELSDSGLRIIFSNMISRKKVPEKFSGSLATKVLDLNADNVDLLDVVERWKVDSADVLGSQFLEQADPKILTTPSSLEEYIEERSQCMKTIFQSQLRKLASIGPNDKFWLDINDLVI